MDPPQYTNYANAHGSLLDSLAEAPDPRKARGKQQGRYPARRTWERPFSRGKGV